jgi:hypothetical protein
MSTTTIINKIVVIQIISLKTIIITTNIPMTISVQTIMIVFIVVLV